ncbi:MAG: phosphotransferase [Treponema sp.]
MKRRYFQIIQLMKENESIPQREIAKRLNISLAYVNKILFSMEIDGFLHSEGTFPLLKRFLTEKALTDYEMSKVDNAIIMAAGFGSRFVPLTYATPKGLLEVFGERMIERQIKQLHEVGIKDITVVVGYLKDTFEYLIDKYGVKLLYNPDYKEKNNLSTLYHARHELKNTYILSSDNWMRENMYHSHEYDSWYASIKVSEKTKEWVMKLGLHDKITDIKIGGMLGGWIMYGPVFFSKTFSSYIKPLLEKAYNKEGTDEWYWENVLKENLHQLTMFANKQPSNQIYEFESLDELRLFDSSYLLSTKNEYMALIASVLGCSESSIMNIHPSHFGMTNKSFLFEVSGAKYIFRLPGEGTEQMINRYEEYAVYQAIRELNISDKLIYFNPETGIKITQYEVGSHNANANNIEEVKKCMEVARQLHSSNIKVTHTFDFRERISYYEELAKSRHGILFNDYEEVKQNMEELLLLLDGMTLPSTLTHIDLVSDNFLIKDDGTIRLIDWEYAGIADPIIDIAMFAIYSYYDHEKIINLFEIYLKRKPTNEEILRLYCYISLSGFLWTLWTCYKQALGVSFGDYGLKMYRYAKDYYKKAIELKQNS